MDALCFEVLEKINNIEKENVTPDTFRDYITSNFVTASLDGRSIELKENGANIPVTYVASVYV